MALLEGKVILITGGTSGIGRASAVLFAKEGARVALTGRRAAEGAAVVAEIEAAGGEALFIEADVTQTETIPETVARTVARFGRLDGAFNNAGVSAGPGEIDMRDEATWDKVIDTNLKSVFFCVKAQIAQMRAQGQGGSIVLNASVLAQIGAPGTAIYSASKGGVVSMARALATEVGRYGIRINTVNPSITRTEMTAGSFRREADGTERHPLAGNVPLGRVAEASEIAEPVLFLLSDRASYITGHALTVDGGVSAG